MSDLTCLSEIRCFYPNIFSVQIATTRLWLKAVTEPNSAIHTAIAEWTRPESTENDGSVRFSDTGI